MVHIVETKEKFLDEKQKKTNHIGSLNIPFFTIMINLYESYNNSYLGISKRSIPLLECPQLQAILRPNKIIVSVFG